MRKAESRLDRAFQGMFRKRANVNVRPVELAWKLVKEMEDNKLPSASRVFVPHEYTVYLCPSDHSRFQPYQESLVRQLQNHLLHHARKNAFSMTGAPAVTVEKDPDLRTGEFGIGVGKVVLPGVVPPAGVDLPKGAYSGLEADPANLGQPSRVPPPGPGPLSPSAPAPTDRPPAQDAPGPGSRPAAVSGLVVLRRGRYSQEFRAARVVLGRGSEADYRLEDPNVSRRHAVIAWENGRLFLRDLGSTNGTFLNGRTVNSASLHSGDVITLGESQITVETG